LHLGFRVYYEEDDCQAQLDLTDLTDFPSNLSPDEHGTVHDNTNYQVENITTDVRQQQQQQEEDSSGPSFAQMLKVSNGNVSTPSSQPTSRVAWGIMTAPAGMIHLLYGY